VPHPVRFTVITYQPPTDPRLGRVVEHDERSRNYAFTLTQPTHTTVNWTTSAPVLDQGDVGSCTGNAMAQLLDTDHFTGTGLGGKYLDETDALTLYELATRLDHMPGEYPPTDRGSSGVAVAKAAEKLSYITRYEHCFGWPHFQAAIETQPVIVGTLWTQQMMTPGPDGLVTVGELSDQTVMGGHEYLCRGINYETQRITFRNSWGAGWGDQGEFAISFTDFETLLACEGDVTVPQR
jgi:hypothetical protein